MPYVAPLRSAVIALVERDRPFHVDALSALGGADLRRSRGYAAQLVRAGVLLSLDWPVLNRVFRGRRYQLWLEKIPRTKKGGHRITHRAPIQRAVAAS